MQMLATKFRPTRFNDLVGQQHVAIILKNIVARYKRGELPLPNSMVFAGTRGCGKTSTARIYGAELNCEEDNPPCGSCTVCQQIFKSQSPVVLEIDSATNGNVDSVNRVKTSLLYANSGKQVVIWDEAHCLSQDAQILTYNGFRTIDDIRPGIQSGSGVFLKNTSRTNEEQMITIITPLMTTNRYTATHPVKVLDGDGFTWKQAQEITEKDKLCVPLYYNFDTPPPISFNTAHHGTVKPLAIDRPDLELSKINLTVMQQVQLIAYYITSGTIKANDLILTLKSDEVGAFVEFLLETQIPFSRMETTDDTTTCVITSNEIVTFLLLRIGNDLDKSLPGWILSLPPDLIQETLDMLKPNPNLDLWAFMNVANAWMVALMLITQLKRPIIRKEKELLTINVAGPIEEDSMKGGYFLLEVIEVKEQSPEDIVYNFETSTQDFMAPFVVHNSISPKGFDALLKTTEEGIQDVSFLFLTTEPHRIPNTITSRSLRFDFLQIDQQDISDRLKMVLEQEAIEFEPEVISLIAREAGGSMRDAIVFADQLRMGYDAVNVAGFEEAFGVDTSGLFAKLINAMYNFDTATVDKTINEIVARVPDTYLAIERWIDFEIELLNGKIHKDLENRQNEQDILMRMEMLWFLTDKVKTLNISTRSLLRLTCVMVSARLTRKILNAEEAFALLSA